MLGLKNCELNNHLGKVPFKNMIKTILCLLLFSSCNLLLGVKSLGDGYYFDTDQIIYTENWTYNGIGICIVPPKVVSIKKDDNFIIAESLNNLIQKKYWIIQKNINKTRVGFHDTDSLYKGFYQYNNIFGPLDSAEFIITKESLGIRL